MKIQNDQISIFMEKEEKPQGTIGVSGIKQKETSQKSGNIFAGNLNMPKDEIAEKRKEAQEKAMKIVRGAYEGDFSIDDDLKARSARIDTLNDEIGEAQNKLDELEQNKEKLQEQYGITNESSEQKDLELLEKRRDLWKTEESLTEEETARLTEIDEKGMTEYQQRSLKIDSYGSPYREVINNNQKEIIGENAVIHNVNKERLKYNPVLEAKQQADSIMDSANKEIQGMLLDDAKDHIDEEQEKVEEEAEKKAEEKKEQDEKIEHIKEKKEEMEAIINKDGDHVQNTSKSEQSAVNTSTEQMVKLDQLNNDVKKEVQDMVDKMKLVMEDIKGAAVDTTV